MEWSQQEGRRGVSEGRGERNKREWSLMTHVYEDAMMKHMALCYNLKINKSLFKKMKWSHGSETHLHKLHTSDFLVTDGSIWEMNAQPWVTVSQFQLMFWYKPDSSVISALDLFWKHSRVSRQNHNILCSLLLGSPFSGRTKTELERPTGNIREQVGPLHGARGHSSEIPMFWKTEDLFSHKNLGNQSS